MTRELTDSQRFWKVLHEAEHRGVHSWECYGWTRNASQRAKDVTSKGQQVYVSMERRNGRPGARYWLEGFEPDYAVAVKPNNDVAGDAGTPQALPVGVSPGAVRLVCDATDRSDIRWREERIAA